MFYNSPEYRPPLPPRSPRPPSGIPQNVRRSTPSPILEHKPQHSVDRHPPAPPRPVGCYGIPLSTHSHYASSSTSYPPPTSLGNSAAQHLNLPVYQESPNRQPVGLTYEYRPAPPLPPRPLVQGSNALVSFPSPPPPSGPPPAQASISPGLHDTPASEQPNPALQPIHASERKDVEAGSYLRDSFVTVSNIPSSGQDLSGSPPSARTPFTGSCYRPVSSPSSPTVLPVPSHVPSYSKPYTSLPLPFVDYPKTNGAGTSHSVDFSTGNSLALANSPAMTSPIDHNKGPQVQNSHTAVPVSGGILAVSAHDPIEELMRSMGLDCTFPQNLALDKYQHSNPLSEPFQMEVHHDGGGLATSYLDYKIAPLRPPKTPLLGSLSPASSQVAESPANNQPNSQQYLIPRSAFDTEDGTILASEPAHATSASILASSPQSVHPTTAYLSNQEEAALTWAPETNISLGIGFDSRLDIIASPRSTETPYALNINQTGMTQGDPDPDPVATACIDTPVTFSTIWYFHPATPDFFICSRCFTDHLYFTQFRDSFRSMTFSDGYPRCCKFSIPRMKERIFEEAVTNNYMQPMIDWMSHRSLIPDCKGADGVKGVAGVKWFNAKNAAIPGFVVCEACYEDHVLCNNLSSFFQPCSQVQEMEEYWACDFAIPFILKQYEADGKTNNWNNFALEAKSRLSIPPCPQNVPCRAKSKQWFSPVNGPAGLIICAACYCDKVVHTGEEGKWQIVTGLTETDDAAIFCALGRYFHIRIAMVRAHELQDFSVFWTALRGVESHKSCDEQGITDGEWYTLKTDPFGFQICAACLVAVAEPLKVSHFFKRKSDVPAGTTLMCCFNLAHPRMESFIPRLLEMYYIQNPTGLTEYAKLYASLPLCKRNDQVENGSWYGWPECTICPDCYHSHLKHEALTAHMPLNNTQLSGPNMCELYSERMRALYKACSNKSPPDATELLDFSRRRRQVYAQTVPRIRMLLLLQQQQASQQQSMLNQMSMFHTTAGTLQLTNQNDSAYTYNMAGHRIGYSNMDLSQDYAEQQQAMGVLMGAHGLVGQCALLEQEWKAVE